MKRNIFPVIFIFAAALFLPAQDVTENRPITIPVFDPNSDRFFGAEFQYALSKSPSFFFFDAYGDLFETPQELKAPNDSSSGGSVRMAAAIGSMFPLNKYLSGMAGVSFVADSVYMAESINFFIGAGLFGHYDPWGIGLRLLGGYYRDSYKELPLNNNGFYSGIREDLPGQITNAARFMIVPRLSLSDKIFFLDEIGANIGVSEKPDEFNILSRLAFKALQIGALRLGINVYYNQYKYNLLLDQRLIGAKFETKYLSIDAGYRQFVNSADNPFVANYEDGMYGRIIVKIFPRNNVPILLSYGFEQTFEVKHFFGLGVSFAPDESWINDYLYEFSGINNMRIIASNYTGSGKTL
jgi:hypothetical protein